MIKEEVLSIIENYDKLVDYVWDFCPKHLRHYDEVREIELSDKGIRVSIHDYRCGGDDNSYTIPLKYIHSKDEYFAYLDRLTEEKKLKAKQEAIEKDSERKEIRRQAYMRLKEEFGEL